VRRLLVLALLNLLLGSAVAWAQLSTAQLSGKVTDESGAVLPGVTAPRCLASPDGQALAREMPCYPSPR